MNHGEFVINFFLTGKPARFAYRRLVSVPRIGDLCVFNETRYEVKHVEWCLDDDATERGTLINIDLVPRTIKRQQ